MTVVALGRLMANDCEKLVDSADSLAKIGGLLTNQKNAIPAVYDGFEGMVLGFGRSCANFANTAMARIADCRRYDRVKHAYHRYVQKPIGKRKAPIIGDYILE